MAEDRNMHSLGQIYETTRSMIDSSLRRRELRTNLDAK